jgi:hypothetical protein
MKKNEVKIIMLTITPAAISLGIDIPKNDKKLSTGKDAI